MTATWSLPTSVRSEFFEVAKYPDVNVYGYFQNLARSPKLRQKCGSASLGVASQTSLTS